MLRVPRENSVQTSDGSNLCHRQMSVDMLRI